MAEKGLNLRAYIVSSNLNNGDKDISTYISCKITETSRSPYFFYLFVFIYFSFLIRER